jgi:acyl carrier protein
MERQEVVSRLEPLFRTVLKNDSLELSDALTANDVDGWDSLTHMLLIAKIEDAFNIKFKFKDLNKMENVGSLIDIIRSKL